MKFIVHDYETTGLTLHPQADLESQPRAIEFAAILTDGDVIFEEFEFICNPGMQIEPVITKITGLTNEELEKHEPFSSHLGAVKSAFSSADCVISHNLSFDKAISSIEARHLGIGLPELGWPGIECCTVEQTFHQFGRRLKLSELYEMKLGKYDQKHRAMDDLILLHKICNVYGIYDAFKRGREHEFPAATR